MHDRIMHCVVRSYLYNNARNAHIPFLKTVMLCHHNHTNHKKINAALCKDPYRQYLYTVHDTGTDYYAQRVHTMQPACVYVNTDLLM